jgi:hypothetical protein
MNRSKTLSLLPVLLLTVLSLAACSGPKNRCTTNCGTGTATVNLTLVSDTPPASPSLLSYKVTVTQVTVTPTTGTAFTFTPNPAPVFELLRLQSDSTFVATLLNVPSGTYSSITLSLGSPQITFLNNTNATITNAASVSGACVVGAICTISPSVTGQPQVSAAPFPIILSSNAKIGLGIDFNLSNSITVTGGTMTVTFTPATAGVNVLSAFNLPRNSSLTGNQLDLIEDFVGVVSVTGQSVTLTSQTRGTLTALTATNTNFDPDPSDTLCLSPSSSCIKASQVASIDAILNSDGTLSIQEFEPLLSAQIDVVEGTVVAITQSNQAQFTIVTTDKVQLATNTLIGSLKVGDPLTVNIVNTKPFLVDQKGLPVSQNFNGSFINFANATTTGAIHLGQTVAVHVTSFTAATASALASSNTDTVTLRWSRLTATPISQPGPTFNFINIPGYFNLPSSTSFEVQTFVGTAGADGVTNLEGIANVNAIDDTKPIALRALYLQNTTNSQAPVFFAAKVRQH